ncbi:hypothetical protein CRUP_019615 [Coryphaenoides rupestris]|nr:hypothetical protein CRUP_019615 [Coryphaenoides rupestris]
MEEELHYSTIKFRANNVSPCDSIIIKDVMSKEPSRGHDLIRSENRSKYFLLIAAVCLGILSLLLLSIVIHQVLHTREPQILERQVEDLKRERDALNWTMNVITGMDTFPVKEYCYQKGTNLCRPCRLRWKVFGSSCYFFSFQWKSWRESSEFCRGVQAQLVAIQTQEEQEFIRNHTGKYSDSPRGYWMGLSLKAHHRWTWEDGSEPSTAYWVNQMPPSGVCILTLHKEDRLATWSSAHCTNNHRWICESPALMKTD